MIGNMVRCCAFLVVCLLAVGCAPVHGATSVPQRIVLVELFTSQGCSSCPAADAFVKQLPALGFGRDRVLPLTFHVDYWDDLGWKDPFASPAFTERQRRYARRGRLRSPEGGDGISGLYTPQMIIDGSVHFSGSRRALALAEIKRAAAVAAPLQLSGTTRLEGDHAAVTVRAVPTSGAAAAQAGDWQLFVALAARTGRTSVTRGENRGETLEEAAIVRVLSAPVPLGGWSDAIHVGLDKPPGLAWADVELCAFAQSTSTLQIGGAVALRVAP